MSVDEVLSKCLQSECRISQETIATHLNKLSNIALQAYLREHNCRQCLDHDKRRKTENVEYIARRVVTGTLMSDRNTFGIVTDFMTDTDLGQLSSSNQALHVQVDPILIPRRTWGPEVLDWSRERRNMVKSMRIDEMDRPLERGDLPANLIHLEFGDRHPPDPYRPTMKLPTVLMPGVLPPSLTHIEFGYLFNQALDQDVLPPNLTHLEFGDKFNQPVARGVLPPSLTHIEFGNRFNQPLRDVLSNLPNLTQLKFGNMFNQTLRGVLLNLSNLTQLQIGNMFNHPLTPGTLPPSLTHLRFGKYSEFKKPLTPGALPPSLKYLRFGKYSEFNKLLARGTLPPSLTHVEFGYHFNKPLDQGVLPPSLTHLEFGWNFNQPLARGTLSNLVNTTHLELGGFDQPLDRDVLPPRLTHLKLLLFNQPLVSGVLPLSLTHLYLGLDFNHPLDQDVLPPNLHLKYKYPNHGAEDVSD